MSYRACPDWHALKHFLRTAAAAEHTRLARAGHDRNPGARSRGTAVPASDRAALKRRALADSSPATTRAADSLARVFFAERPAGHLRPTGPLLTVRPIG
jgi:hypothetical protein